MIGPDAALIARARRAYERGRLLHGVRIAAVVPAMAVLSVFGCGRPAATLAIAASLAAFVVGLVWKGGGAGQGVRLGLRIGLAPLVLPLMFRAAHELCSAFGFWLFPAACAFGVVGGALLGRLGRPCSRSPECLACASVALALTGSLGCLMAGLIAGATPVLVLRRA
jgi:hypothetical protein